MNSLSFLVIQDYPDDENDGAAAAAAAVANDDDDGNKLGEEDLFY